MRTFGHDAPRLSWLNGKTYPQQGDSRKNRSGHAPEETDARIENGIGVLARQELKDRVDAMRPKIAETPISVTENLDFQPSPEAEISIGDLANELL
jgi:hypothetical protein